MPGKIAVVNTVLLALLLGCSGEGDVVSIAVPGKHREIAQKPGTGDGPSIGIYPFKDVRRDKSQLGSRIGRFGALDGYVFEVEGGRVGPSIAEAMEEYVAAKGWHVVHMPEGGDNQPDIVLEGEVRQFYVEGLNNWFTTTIRCQVNVLVSGHQGSDGSRIEVPLAAERMREVRWFDPLEVQALVNEVLEDAYGQLVAATRFEGKQMVVTRR